MRTTTRMMNIKGIKPFRIIQKAVYGAWRSDIVLDDAVCDVKEIYYLQKRVWRFLPFWVDIGLSASLEEIVEKLNEAKRENENKKGRTIKDN